MIGRSGVGENRSRERGMDSKRAKRKNNSSIETPSVPKLSRERGDKIQDAERASCDSVAA